MSTLKPRNPVAQSPLMRKGGVHEKGATAKRQQTRTKLTQQLDDWQDDLAFEREMQHVIDQKDLADDLLTFSLDIQTGREGGGIINFGITA